MKASVALTADYDGKFRPQAYTKHRGDMPAVIQAGPMAPMSDRSPDAVKERRDRLRFHRRVQATNKTAFRRKNRDISSYAEEMSQAACLIGNVHPVTRTVFSKRKQQEEMAEPMNLTLQHFEPTRPRTTGYSPGNARSLSPPPMIPFSPIRSRQRPATSCGSIGSLTTDDGASFSRFDATSVGRAWALQRELAIKEARERRKRRDEMETRKRESMALADSFRSEVEDFDRKMRETHSRYF